MAELINRNDSLNDGREKLNKAIVDSNKSKVDSEQALITANESKQQSENTQQQLDQVVIDGDSSVEAAQARVDAENNTYPTLKARLDAKETQTSEQLAQTPNEVMVESFKTTSNTWTSAFQSAIDYAVSNKFKVIRLPRATNMVIDQTIKNGGTLNAFDLVIKGDGKGIDGRGSALTFTGTGHLFENDLTDPIVGVWRGITFENISFRGTNKENHGVYIAFNQQTIFRNCEFIAFDHAVRLTGNSHYPMFDNCKFISCNSGIKVIANGEPNLKDGGVNNGIVMNTFWTYCEHPIDITGNGSGWTVQNSDVEGFNGTTRLMSYNKLINVRIERNNTGTWLKVGNNNDIDVYFATAGGTLPLPALDLGNHNKVSVNGSVQQLINETGEYNTINVDWLKPFNPSHVYPLIDSISKTNKLINNGNQSNNLVSTDLSNWININSGITITDSTFSNGDFAQQLVNVDGGKKVLTTTINKEFKKGDFLVCSFDYEFVAGGGYTLNIDDLNFDSSHFDVVTSNKKTVFQYLFREDKTAIDVHIGFSEVSGVGSSFKIGNFAISNMFSDEVIQ